MLSAQTATPAVNVVPLVVPPHIWDPLLHTSVLTPTPAVSPSKMMTPETERSFTHICCFYGFVRAFLKIVISFY